MKTCIKGMLFLICIFVVAPLLHLPVNINFPTEAECKAFTIWHEARGEPLQGQRAVLDVVENRMRKQGKNACQIMMQHKQFSFYYYGMPVVITQEMMYNYENVIAMGNVVGKATHFHTKAVSPYWNKELTFIREIGSHLFYK